MSPRCFQMPPRCFQDASRCSPDGSRCLPDASRDSQMLPRCLQMLPDDPDASQMLPDASQMHPDASQMPPDACRYLQMLPDASSSPLTCDVPQVPPPQVRFDSDRLIKKTLKNTVQTYCIFRLKMEPKRRPECARYLRIVTKILKNTSHENMHVKMIKQGETQALQCLIFESPLE